MNDFTAASLPRAIRSLLELNHYSVEGPVQIHGAEIDLVAHPSGPFGVPIYIEATIEYVDNDKYGKDVGKLAMISAVEPGAHRLIVSSQGFSLPVRERAGVSGIKALTYDELFRTFERFDPYIALSVERGPLADDLAQLNRVYEEPLFDDKLGRDPATAYLTQWRDSPSPTTGWLIIIGEYGTGKTALTKVLQYRWARDYKTDPSLPLPFRIQLRDFARQFDARGLLHHFLDHNGLSHVPLDFVLSLIRRGRVILLLDGYDEMAQYLHARERRACLEALAELAAEGARGILTSRPNYFTEAEELQVFEVLYAALRQGQYYISTDTQALIEREKRVDKLLESFMYRFERSLKDLTPEQTEALLERVLGHDPEGRAVVVGILRRLFRNAERSDAVALYGKPVIITYLLDVVEGLKSAQPENSFQRLTEWQVYKLIVDHLMLRDLTRSPELSPEDRRTFLRTLAVFLSGREHRIAGEEDIKDLISKQFRRELQRLPTDTRVSQIERYFADLRSSATLTRSIDGKEGWSFSHNSLREFLITEYLLAGLERDEIIQQDVPISDAMRAFAASRTEEDRRSMLGSLAKNWRLPQNRRGCGQLLTLLWDGALQLFTDDEDPRRACLRAVASDPPDLRMVSLSRIALSIEGEQTSLRRASFADAFLSVVDLQYADLREVDFSGATLESVSLAGARLSGARFSKALLIDVDLSGAELNGASFVGVKPAEVSLLVENPESAKGRVRIGGEDAVGYLQFHGAETDAVSQRAVLQHHPRFEIIDKIVRRLAEQTIRQRRGLEQRGAARQDVAFARKFVAHLEHEQLIRKHRRDMIEVTEAGREMFSTYTNTGELPSVMVNFLRPM